MNLLSLRSIGCRIALVAAAWLAAGSAQAAAYVYSEVSRPGAESTSLWGINNRGQMVGHSVGADGFFQAFIYDGSRFTGLSGPAGAVASTAMGISDAGVVVGAFSNTKVVDSSGETYAGPSQGFLYSAGTYTPFMVAGSVETHLRGISPDGRYVTGYYVTETLGGVGFVYDLLNAALSVVSRPDSTFTIAQGVNNSGVVVGSDVIPGTIRRLPGFFYDVHTGVRTDVDIAGAARTAQRAIAEDGVVAGWFQGTDNLQHGFVGSVTHFQQVDMPGADGTYIEGRNQAGTLVGGFNRGSDVGAFFARLAVPEPSTAVVLVTALLLLAGGRLRRRAALAGPRG